MTKGGRADVQALTKKLIAFRDARDWKQFHTPKDLAISLALEAAEVLEHFQWRSPADVERHIKEDKDEIAAELADVFNWILIMANDLKVDILKESAKRIEINARKYPVAKSKGRHTKYTKL